MQRSGLLVAFESPLAIFDSIFKISFCNSTICDFVRFISNCKSQNWIYIYILHPQNRLFAFPLCKFAFFNYYY